MKKVMFAVGIIAAMVAVSCNKSESVTEATGEPEYYEVKIGMDGAITSEIVNMTKSEESNNLIGIDVWSTPDDGESWAYYANGLFDTSDITVKLLTGYKYKFRVISAINGKSINGIYDSIFRLKCGVYSGSYSFSGQQLTNSMEYSASKCYVCDTDVAYPVDLYYGELDGYTPQKDGSVTIELLRASFGLNISVVNLNEGKVKVSIPQNTIFIEYPSTTYYGLYSMQRFSYVARTDHLRDQSEGLGISAELERADGTKVNLGAATLKVYANKITNVTINASAPLTENTFSFNYQEDHMADSDDSYSIGGGEEIDTPVE